MFNKNYTEGVDFKFLEAMGIEVVHHQPWQLGLFHEELEGKFVWYPYKGTLMYQDEKGYINKVIGRTGMYLGVNDTTEDVYNIIMKKLTEQENAAS